MQNKVLGLVFADNPEVDLGVLMNNRSLAAVPVGGRYRIIDFILSNMVNSGIINIGITTQSNYQSLMDHIGTGRSWDLDRKNEGLFLLPPYIESATASDTVLGGIDTIHGAMDYLKRSRQEYVIVSNCNTICNIDYRKVFKAHIDNDADITMVCFKVDKLEEAELKRSILVNANAKSGLISDIQIYPSKQSNNLSYMHAFLIKRELLIDLVEDCVSHGEHIISKDLLLRRVKNGKVFAYIFDGYNQTIDSIQTFFKFNLDLLKKEIRDELFATDGDNKIYTKPKDMTPTKYGKGADVSASFIADGCKIEGVVKNSIIFRGVNVGSGASIENSIIMQQSDIMDNCMVENAIFDKEVILRSGKKLVGQETYPVVIGKRTVV